MNCFYKSKHSIPLFAPLLLSVALLITPSAEAAGLLQTKDSGYKPLSIKQHHVEVVIEDMYATTTVEQVFHNPNTVDLEAIYSFPVPANAAVGEFSYWIDDKAVTGEVIEKKRAREIYNEEKQQGREAAIVEKDQHKTFDIAVYPVRANQDVKIKLVYLQNTQTDTEIGRYVYPLEEGGVDEQAMSFWNRNETVDEQFSFNMKLRSSYPVDGLRLPKHPQAIISQINPNEWSVNLVNSTTITQSSDDEVNELQSSSTAPAITLNQDIVLYWRHAPGLPASVDMIAYKEPNHKKGTFKLTLTDAGNRLEMSAITDTALISGCSTIPPIADSSISLICALSDSNGSAAGRSSPRVC